LEVFMKLLRPQTCARIDVQDVAALVLLQRGRYVFEDIVCGIMSAAAGKRLSLLER
jgi:hypothetical protein